MCFKCGEHNAIANHPIPSHRRCSRCSMARWGTVLGRTSNEGRELACLEAGEKAVLKDLEGRVWHRGSRGSHRASHRLCP
jgi:hypothetical protein